MSYKLYNALYQYDLGAYRVCGDCPERFSNSDPFIFPSCPVSFDREEKTFTTKNGSVYEIMNCIQDEDEFWAEIEKNTINKAFTRELPQVIEIRKYKR